MSRRTTNEPLDERHDGNTWSYDVPYNDGAQYLPHDQVYEDDYDETNANGDGGLTKPGGKTHMVAGAALVDIDEAAEDIGKVAYSQFASQNETAAERVARLDRERAELVARRRQYTNPIQRTFAKVVPYGGLLSCGLNLAACSIGAGIISLSSAFQISGLAMGLVYLTAIGYLTVFSYTCIGVAGMRTGIRNYEKIVYTLLGKGADYWLAFCLWFLSFGAEVSYVISMQDALRAFINNASSAPAFFKTTGGLRVLTTLVWLVCMLPLVLMKEINSLRYFSFFAIGLVIFFVLAMIIHSFCNGLRHGVRDDLVYFQTGNNAVQGLTIFMYSYISQLNAFEVFGEMHKPSTKRLTQGAGIGVVLAFVLYLFAGLFGYLDFGPAVVGSSLNLYNPIKEPLMGVAYVGLMVKICVAYGLNMIPVRGAIYHVANLDVRTLAWWKNALACTAMAICSLLGGLFIPKINLVFGLVGGFAGGFIGFIFPALMYMYSGNWGLRSVGIHNYIVTYVLLFVGIVGVVFGTLTSIYGALDAA